MRLPEDSRCMACSMLPRLSARARSDWIEAMFVLITRAIVGLRRNLAGQMVGRELKQRACQRESVGGTVDLDMS